MPVRQRASSSVAGPSKWEHDVKPNAKPKFAVIDLCDSDDATPPSKPAQRPKTPTWGFDKIKYESDSRSPDDSEDDFDRSSSKARTTKRGSLAASSSSAPKLYAIAQIVTLATDGAASASESEAKLASVSSGILSRIQKSLALAKHPGTGEAEAQQALRLATRLMSSQNLTQADLLTSSSDETNLARAGMSIVEIVSQTSAAPRNESWVNQIAIAVNLFFDVKAYSTSYANRTKLSWTFYGLAVNTVAAAHAFEMVHNQVLTWAFEKAQEKLVKGKTGKNSYCQGVAAGLIGLAKKEKKEELRLAIEGEKKRLKEAEQRERAQDKKEKERLRVPLVKAEITDEVVSSTTLGPRNVKLEDGVDEEDVKPPCNGIQRSASQEFNDGNGRWTQHSDHGELGSVKLESGSEDSDNDDLNNRFYDTHDRLPTPSFGGDEDDIKPHFDEALERDIIDLTSDLDTTLPRIKPDPSSEDIKPKPEPEQEGAGWQSGKQLIRFRQDADKIADDYLASQHSDLKLKKRARTTYKKDSSAFEQGRQDARLIDVKRKRIQA
ncbi:uncharacterized protein MEPE_02562 [Melanopsichium pennsylvanicum]|uniref:DUF2786 domain-containing protein n=2 Tax=Melanopsichium pennsylvanicum TaxID=63383 RepID=A0AAJ4XK63_9BASI|nr:conserved hypothetical protein [Melanopsichium pennsylvanicum 4]SNX83854.1 uncharacterized protein MEPE_02562 [Melanopsichium pennsylvanicum]